MFYNSEAISNLDAAYFYENLESHGKERLGSIRYDLLLINISVTS